MNDEPGYRIVNIAGHEIIQTYDSCPVCGDDMQDVVFVGKVCWTCYDKKDRKELYDQLHIKYDRNI
jgi:hypothetical protein